MLLFFKKEKSTKKTDIIERNRTKECIFSQAQKKTKKQKKKRICIAVLDKIIIYTTYSLYLKAIVVSI